jgi:hypothetical protein
VEDLIKMMAAQVLSRLDDLEKESDFDYLLNLSDPQLRSEASDLYQSICKLREDLRGLL